MITGPPASGKTYYSEKLNKLYNIPIVNVKQISDKALMYSQTEEEEGIAAEIKAKLEEVKDQAISKLEEEATEKGEEPPEIDREKFKVRVPNDIIYQLLKIRLNENDCRNRGYILDGYPRNLKDCQYIFLKKAKKFDPETGEEIDEGEPELEEGEYKLTKHLIEQGYRDMAFVGGSKSAYFSKIRLNRLCYKLFFNENA